MTQYETAIIGGGITGLALARELALRGGKSIAVFEKEPSLAVHASGRNSGVLHAGYNLKPGSLKASFCVEGNRLLRDYCRKRGVALVEGGILVAACRQNEIPVIEELEKRARANGVPGVKILEPKEMALVEPNAAGLLALHAPSGASIDAPALVSAVAEEIKSLGVDIHLGCAVEDARESGSKYELLTNRGAYQCEKLINCAGLHVDEIAHKLGVGLKWRIIPVRGEYRRLRPERAGLIRSMIYPVPDLHFPFLGIHWTKTVKGDVIVGPNAVPALGREAYSWGQSTFAGVFDLAASAPAWRLLLRRDFSRFLFNELKGSLSTSNFTRAARRLVPDVRPDDFIGGPSGIRAQVIDRQGNLVEDFAIEKKGSSLHVLNVVSPGLTSSFAFARHLADNVG